MTRAGPRAHGLIAGVASALFVLSRIPREDGPSYWLAIERILGSLRIDGVVDPPGAS